MVLKNRKKTVKDDINHLFKHSMLTGIPQIVAARSWKKRLIRSIVLIVCVSGFTYQTLAFMNVYWRYQTVVDVQVYSPIEIVKPAFTVCGDVGFMSSRFCPTVDEEFTNKTGVMCETLENDKYIDYCFCHPRMCTENKGLKNVTLITEDGINWVREQPWDYVKQFMASDQDYMDSCVEVNMHLNDTDYDCKPPRNSVTVPCYSGGYYPEICFTRDSFYGKPDSKPQTVLSFGENWFFLKTLEMEYPTNLREPRLFISFHSPYTIKNPITHGYILERMHTYQYRLSKVVKDLLPYPYETDCVDYLGMWKARGGKGPTDLNECIQECLRNRSLEVHGCKIRGINYPGYDLQCDPQKFDDDLIPSSRECVDKRCKPACHEEYYVTTADASIEPFVDSCKKSDILKLREDEASIVLQYSGMETTVYTYKPKYLNIEIFSYIGGYIGMWLGISLVAVFDFLETMVTMMLYPLKRIHRLRQKNKVNRFNAKMKRMY